MQIASGDPRPAFLMTDNLLQVRQVSNPSSQTGRDHCVPETMHQPPLSIIIKVRDTKLIADIS